MMKALPKLMKNSVVSIEIVSEEMPRFMLVIHGATSWPSVGRYDDNTRTLRVFDFKGTLLLEQIYDSFFKDALHNFGLIFIGVTESRVDFQTKSQTLVAKMRAINLDAPENLHGDNWAYDE